MCLVVGRVVGVEEGAGSGFASLWWMEELGGMMRGVGVWGVMGLVVGCVDGWGWG